jgi:pyridoxamine 5'-phosphate oxidase-like protein
MGRVHDGIDDQLRAFLERQPVFFVATAPLRGDGHVNASPKGVAGTFAVLDESHVAYLDLTGSGIETIAHVRENGRRTLMFCAFRRSGHDRQAVRAGHGHPADGARVRRALGALSDGQRCSRGDHRRPRSHCRFLRLRRPRMEFVEHRDRLTSWAASLGHDGLSNYRAERNHASIDGLPGY